MKVIKVEGGTMAVGQGARLLLSTAQASGRGHNLEAVKPAGEGVVAATARTLLQFKAGEVLGIDALPKSMAHLAVELDGKAAKKDSAAAVRLVKAADRLAEAEAAAEAERVAEARRAAEEAERAAAAAAEAEAAKTLV